jgi:hypothetical protein
VITADSLRLPPPSDPTASAYKDWLHLNLFDHARERIGLVNVSLHGAPDDARSVAVGAALVWHSDTSWRGNVVVRPFDEAAVGFSRVALDRVAVAVEHAAERVHASVQLPDDGFRLKASAAIASAAIDVEHRLPLGPGWISWYVVPRLELSGTLDIDGESSSLEGASAYHDHNWGRWHWGQDFGWEWGTFQAPAPGPTFVLARVTDRNHEHAGRWHFSMHLAGRQHRFPPSSVSAAREDRPFDELVRLPGAQAALHQQRLRPRLPRRLTVQARDGKDRVDLEFEAWSAAQLVTADPATRGYGFIHEIAGRFEYSGLAGGEPMSGAGLAIVEHVD